jgi:cell division protein FtsZ
LEDEVMITVIATGFEGEELSRPVVRSLSAASHSLENEAVREYQPRRGERPAFMRRSSGTRDGTSERAAARTMMAAEEEWDVPTFLRRQVD